MLNYSNFSNDGNLATSLDIGQSSKTSTDDYRLADQWRRTH